eukprot:GHUV01000749.1.p1 GENE.GHUV01000749.1~~GHUV01000749.1.p1  ORF type:complete len:297 (+),score=74.09 GHUV01000749.1:221-1111(+)
MKHHHGTSAQLKEALIASGNWSEQFCDESCLQRYLRARNMDVAKAHDMLVATLKWRKEHRVDELNRAEFVSCRYMKEGWVYVDGNDADGRSVVMFRKRRDSLPVSESETYLRYMTFVIETAVKNMKNGQEQWIWILDLSVYSPRNAPPLSLTLSVLQMLADHYPERLYKAYVVNAPSVFQFAYKIIYPFIDEVTRSKAEFVNSKDFYAPSKPATSTWGSWASSMFHTKSSNSTTAQHQAAPAGPEADAAVQVKEDGCDAKIVTKCPAGSTFKPLLSMFERPFSYDRQQDLLTSCGW